MPTFDFTRPTLLLGGSFDPIHRGHLHMACAAWSAIPALSQNPSQLLFVPCAQTNGKQKPLASGNERAKWIELALPECKKALATPSAPAIGVWREEIERGGLSYTVDTLQAAHALGAQKNRLYWLMGADAYASFPQWKEPDTIRTLCQIIVVNRPQNALRPHHPADLILEILPAPESSREIRGALAMGQVPEIMLPSAVAQELKKLLLMAQCPYANV